MFTLEEKDIRFGCSWGLVKAVMLIFPVAYCRSFTYVSSQSLTSIQYEYVK